MDSLIKFFQKYRYIYIYGTGDYATYTANKCKELKLNVAGYIISDGQIKQERFFLKKVYFVSEIDFSDEIGVVVALSEKFQPEVINILRKNNCNHYITITKSLYEDVSKSLVIMSFSSRLHILEKWKNEGYKIAVHICEQNSDSRSTYRYRAYNFYQNLNKLSFKWKSIYFFVEELVLLDNVLQYINLVVLCRLKWTFDIDKFINKCRKNGKKIAYDIDDLIYDIKYVPLNMKGAGYICSEEEYIERFSTVSRYQLLSHFADAFITTNAYLSHKIEDDTNKKAYIVHNFINDEQLMISSKCQRNKDEWFKIGYFSGTGTHNKDFLIVAPCLLELMNKYNDIKLEITGSLKVPNYMYSLLNNDRIVVHPLTDYVSLQKNIAGVDLNIVPLQDTEFTNCKSELKFFEASIVNVVTCASKVFAYTSCIDDNKTGFLCDDDNWNEKIEYIYKNRDRMFNIIKNAKEYCLSKYYGRKITDEINKTFDDIYYNR